MHQSTSLSLSQTICPRCVSRQFLTLPIAQSLLPVIFGYSLSLEAVVMRRLRRWKRLWQRSLTRSQQRTTIGPSISCWNGTKLHCNRSRLLRKGPEFHKFIINKSAHPKMYGNSSHAPRIYANTYVLFFNCFRFTLKLYKEINILYTHTNRYTHKHVRVIWIYVSY